MSTRMDGIEQGSLFAGTPVHVSMTVSEGNRYRVLAEKLPWRRIAEVANRYRSQQVDIHNGRSLDLRLHLGALIAQSMNRWTDRETEDMVAHHAGVRLLCGLEFSNETIDHTSIETFRNQLTGAGVAEINKVVVRAASEAGFTGGALCSSDTTVQESPIAYPTEVGHMKNIAEQLTGIGLRIRKGVAKKLAKLSGAVRRTFTKIRLFTRGKASKSVEQKKKLAKEMQRAVAHMQRLVRGEMERLRGRSKERYQDALDLYQLMLGQIRYWMRTGFHRSGKIVSLWERQARAIVRNKASKSVEFGRRWIVTRLEKGYIIGAVCRKLGGDADTGIMPEVLEHFERMMEKLPKLVVYDRGGDGPKNHRTLRQKGIRHNGIFRKAKEALPGLGRNTVLKVRRERALSEAAIATIKNARYGFNKPRAKSSEGCVLKGHAAILGANLAHLARDWRAAAAMAT